MILVIKSQDRNEFNRLAPHPLQSWEWGDFRQKTGIEVVRLGNYQDGKLTEATQLSIHQIPFSSYTIGYLPKGSIPGKEMLEKLVEIGKKYRCIFIKLEPNIIKDNANYQLPTTNYQLITSTHPLFTKYTFLLDLTKSEEEIQKNMHPKTRYNIKVAQKNGVVISEETNQQAFDAYLTLMLETTKRQGFFAHDRKYHELMWETLKDQKSKIPASSAGGKNQNKDERKLTAHLLTAKYKPFPDSKPVTLVTWIVFLLNGVLYYPYGASSDKYRSVMASNLMMWEAIKFGKKMGATAFDMWGSLGLNPDPSDPWFGFHRFKQGYGPKHIEFVGSFDLVISPMGYKLFNFLHNIRQLFLKIKSHFR